MNSLDRLLAQANPVPTPPPGEVTLAQERLLASIVAAPPRRRPSAVVRLLVAAPVVAVAALAFALVIGNGAGVNDETDATTGGGVPTVGNGDVVHVVTRLYGEFYGPGLGERLDGWLEPSTGRARIVITTDGEMTLQQVVDADHRVRSWQGALGNANGMTEDRIAPALAANLRDSVRDRMSFLVASAKQGFRRDNTTLGATTTDSGEYRGRPVTVHRIAPRTYDGKPSGYYFKWFSDPKTDEIIAFERGPVTGGKDVVEQGEELETLETLPPDRAPLDELEWQEPPATARATPSPATPRATPTPAQREATPTPAPPTATPTPAPATWNPPPAATPVPAPRTPTPTPAPAAGNWAPAPAPTPVPARRALSGP